MNISASILSRQKFMSDGVNSLSEIGFKDYKREITLFLKESKNINGIVGHDLVTKINGMITNYSIFDDKKRCCRIFTKTIYVCEVEFPAHITLDMLKRNISGFISVATINPIHGFTNMYLVNKDSFIDFGLSMVDLTLSDNYFNIVNFSDANQEDEYLKDLIYMNRYNPRYYNIFDYIAYGDINNQKRNGLISEFHDDHTTIVCNTHGDESVDNFINNNRQTGIYINKRTIAVSEGLSDLFNKYLFCIVENLEFVYNSNSDSFNITKISLFTKFRNDVEEFICNSINDSIKGWTTSFKSKFKDVDFHLVLSIDKQFAIIDIIFFDTQKEIRITKPLYKLYGEFSLYNESLVNSIEESNNIAQLEYIEQSIKAVSYSDGDINDGLKTIIGIVDNTAKTLQMMVDQKKSEYQSLVGPELRCLEDKSQ